MNTKEELDKYFSILAYSPYYCENTPAGWEEARTVLEKNLSKNSSGNFRWILSTVIEENTRNLQNNILNLQFFFLCADRIETEAPGAEIVLIIKCLNGDDIFRVQTFLYIAAKYRKTVRIAVKHIAENNEIERLRKCSEEYKDYQYLNLPKVSIGRLMPLVRVSMSEALGSIHYRDLISPRDFEKQIDQLVNDDFTELKKYLSHKKLPEYDRPIDLLGRVAEIQLFELFRSVALAKEVKKVNNRELDIETENRNQGIELLLLIKKSLGAMNFLAQILWMYELRYIYGQKNLLKRIREEYGGYESICEYTRWNAIAYAEGLLQLLENSCQHSCGQVGYFSFRVHDVDLETTNAKVLGVAERRERLYRRYRITESEQPLDVYEKCYMEFCVVDDAFDAETKVCCGLLEKANSGRKNDEKYLLQELFEGRELDYEKDPEQILHHYGLGLFRSNIVINNGRFFFVSPGENQEWNYYLSCRQKDKAIIGETKEKLLILDEAGRYTYYRILVPMLNIKQNLPNVPESLEAGGERSLLEDEILEKKPTETVSLKFNAEKILEKAYKYFDIGFQKQDRRVFFETQKEKIECVKKLHRLLENEIIKSVKENFAEQNNECIVYIDMQKCEKIEIEIFSKAIFSMISGEVKKSNSALIKKRNVVKYMALFFANDLAISEFMRIASIFYNRTGDMSWLKNKQIALCGIDDSTALPVVKTVLAGENIASVNETARTFMYYNPELSQNLISQLKYLSRKEKQSSKTGILPLFPFDLALCDENGESWFLRRIEKILQTDLRDDHMGCKLTDVHIRLGSKIHISDFYEAELLFHNVGNIYRFAYCIAEKIVHEIKTADIQNEYLILVGYENYSVLLVSEIVRILRSYYQKKEQNQEIDYMVFARNKKGKESIFYSADMKQKVNAIVENNSVNPLNAKFISILPVGTTMSTIYKIMNVANRDLNNKFSLQTGEMVTLQFIRHYTLIVVSAQGESETLRTEFWKKGKGKKEIILEKESADDKEEVGVEYFLMVQTEWYRSYDCPLCGIINNNHQDRKRIKPLGYVDKTSTIPSLIYPAYKSNFKGISFSIKDSQDNLAKIGLLEGCISYGHITYENNHFQFFVDFPKYYAKCKASDKIRKRLESWYTEQRNTIEREAFNIVVSPLSQLEPNFLKEVIDNVFGGNIRFLYLPINLAYKENVRAKFRYFAEQYKQIKTKNPQMRINIYYVDYSIVSGQTLYRGRNLINMLMEESGIAACEYMNTYKKVFVLLNRSSFDTVNSFVENPRRDYAAFATLAIPSFNTWESTCPICEKVELYADIAKCSATNELYWHYKRLEEKHTARLPDEFVYWQEERYRKYAGYHMKVRQWILDRELIKKSKNENKKTDENNMLTEWLNSVYALEGDFRDEDFLKKDLTLSLDQIFSESSERNRISLFIQKKIVDTKNFLRMICTHNAMELQESLYKREEFQKTSGKNMEQKLMEFLKKEILVSDCHVILKRELLISYIKVLSRGYISYIAPVRETVYLLMNQLLDKLLGLNEGAGEGQITYADDLVGNAFDQTLRIDPSGQDDCRQLYQLGLTLLKRLSDMQSNKILDYRVFCKWKQFVEALIEKSKTAASKDWQLRSTLEEALRDYAQCVKWALAAGEDGGKGFLLNDFCQKMKEDEKG